MDKIEYNVLHFLNVNMFSEKIEIKILYKIFAILILFEKRFGYFILLLFIYISIKNCQ